jgi:hypothetical protein
VRTKPRRSFGSLLLMRKPWLGSRKRVASVSGSLDVDGEVERARSTDRLSDLSNSETSTHAKSAFHLSGGSTTSVAHVLNGRARYAEPNLASFPRSASVRPTWSMLRRPARHRRLDREWIMRRARCE